MSVAHARSAMSPLPSAVDLQARSSSFVVGQRFGGTRWAAGSRRSCGGGGGAQLRWCEAEQRTRRGGGVSARGSSRAGDGESASDDDLRDASTRRRLRWRIRLLRRRRRHWGQRICLLPRRRGGGVIRLLPRWRLWY
uniref:Uncharacterized protein n=1 Tax=Arundo donax TaxID=35708 RepID=A0A0A9EJF7_ARUDO